MFRTMLRKKQELTREECIDILKQELRGVLCVMGDEDYPYGVPINHYYCESDGKLYFHGGMHGHKIDAMKHHDKVSFCVYDQGVHINGEWPLHFKSVIVFGRVEFIEDPDTIYRITRELSHKFTQDEAYIQNEIEHSGPRTLMFALTPEFITGKRVKES